MSTWSRCATNTTSASSVSTSDTPSAVIRSRTESEPNTIVGRPGKRRRRYEIALHTGVRTSSSATGSPASVSPAANAAGDMWLPFVNSTSGRPDERIASSTSTAPGSGRARKSAPRWTSEPSTSKTKPRTSSSRTAPHDEVVVLLHAHVRKRLAPGQLAQQTHDRVASGPRRGRGLAAGRHHRVDLLARHRQAQQQLLVQYAGSEALARALEAERLDAAQLRRPRRRQHAVGDLGVDRR